MGSYIYKEFYLPRYKVEVTSALGRSRVLEAEGLTPGRPWGSPPNLELGEIDNTKVLSEIKAGVNFSYLES